MLSVFHVAVSVLDSNAGTSKAILGLCDALSTSNDIELHTTDEVPSGLNFPAYPHPATGALGFSRSLRVSLLSKVQTTDVVHTHGLWRMPNIYAAESAMRRRAPLLLSTHGMLSEDALRVSSIKKRVFNSFLQKRKLIERVSCYHASSHAEMKDVFRFAPNSTVAVIPFGIETTALEESAKPARRQVIFLGRLHPIKRIDVLIAAWLMIENLFPDWDLIIAGPDSDGYLETLKLQCRNLSAERVQFVGQVEGRSKTELFQQSDLLVLPSASENFGFVVAEALAHGLPVVVSRGAPWSVVSEIGCGWWVDPEKDPIAGALTEAMSYDRDQLSLMGSVGRDWVAERYSWTKATKMFNHLYKWLVEAGPRPEFVHTKSSS